MLVIKVLNLQRKNIFRIAFLSDSYPKSGGFLSNPEILKVGLPQNRHLLHPRPDHHDVHDNDGQDGGDGDGVDAEINDSEIKKNILEKITNFLFFDNFQLSSQLQHFQAFIQYNYVLIFFRFQSPRKINFLVYRNSNERPQTLLES